MNEITSIISSIIGLIGTTGGILISYLTLRHAYRKDRHIIKLEVGEGTLMMPNPDTGKYEDSEGMLTFKVANVGLKDFTITQLGIRVGQRTGSLIINKPLGTVTLPYVLKPDTTCDFWTEYKTFEKGVKNVTPKFKLYSKIRVKAYVRDYIGNSFYSNKMTVTLKTTNINKIKSKLRTDLRNVTKILLP